MKAYLHPKVGERPISAIGAPELQDVLPAETGEGRKMSDDLTRKTDAELAEWQAGWKAESAQHLLAVREWDRRIRWRDRWWSLITVALSILGTLLGVLVGWWLRSP